MCGAKEDRMSEVAVTVMPPEEDEPSDVEQPGATKKVTNPAGKPDWCKAFPAGFQVPKGKRPIFLRFRAEWTDAPHLGERQCVCWGITVGEEHIADKRADDTGSRAIPERAKLSIRLIAAGADTALLPVDQTKLNRDADPDLFWEQIGLKCRTLLTNLFIQTHSLSPEERRDFFENCVEVRDAV